MSSYIHVEVHECNDCNQKWLMEIPQNAKFCPGCGSQFCIRVNGEEIVALPVDMDRL